MDTYNEQDFIVRILDGDTQAFAVLLKRYQRPVHSLIRQVVHCKEDAEELTQDVFVKAFRKLGSFKGDSSLSTWLHRIAYNTAIDATRKQKLFFPDFDEKELNNLADETVDELLSRENDEALLLRLEKAVERLSPEDKALITLYYTEEKSVNEVAAIAGLTPDHTKVKLHRARKKLVLLLNQNHNENG
jgi:RNA polymerase sigma-70 factor, ECF subfamily